jgi:hypothetical protein
LAIISGHRRSPPSLFLELRPGNRAPLVNLRLFTRKSNFAFMPRICEFHAGLHALRRGLSDSGLSGSVAHGYGARQAGAVMAWIGLPQLVIIPVRALDDAANSTRAACSPARLFPVLRAQLVHEHEPRAGRFRAAVAVAQSWCAPSGRR